MKKRWLLFTLALLLLTACAKKDTPSQAVTSFLDAYQSDDREKVESLLVSAESAQTFYGYGEDDILDELIAEKSRSALKYSDIKETINGDSAEITLQMKYPDVGTPLMESFAEAAAKAEKEEGQNPDDLLAWIKEDVEQKLNTNTEMVADEVKVTLKKVDDLWKVDLDGSPDLLNALMGNLANALQQPAE